ncbi:AAA family ATPase [Niallia oryzisoli]|uniref:AAA family ATPase n=1 Tax=Niallia oryzisoli TaxID=1737571 RepID=UPI00373679A9
MGANYMRILSIELEKFKNHDYAHFQFGSYNHFFGDNYTGKSSIGDAIAFALFGINKYLQKIYNHDFVKIGQNKMSVTLVLEINNKTWVIKRSIVHTRTKLEINGIQSKQSNLSEIIGSEHTFMYCFFPDLFPEEEKKKARSFLMEHILKNTEVFTELESSILGLNQQVKSLHQKTIYFQGQEKLLQRQMEHFISTTPVKNPVHTEKMEKLKVEQGILKSEKANILQQIHEINQQKPLQFGEKCPTCQQRIFSNQIELINDNSKKTLIQLEERLKEIEIEIQENETKKKSLQDQTEIFNSTQSNIENHNQVTNPLYAQFEEERSIVNNKLHSLEEEIQLLKLQIKEQRSKLGQTATRYQSDINAPLLHTEIILFKQLKDGELRPDFQIRYKYRPFRMLSTSEKLRCMLEIIHMFQELLQTKYPLFLDNLESMTHLEPLDTQIITSTVKKGMALTLHVK